MSASLRRPFFLHLGPFLVVASLLLHCYPTAGVTALVCPKEMQGPADRAVGEECGGPCNHLGTCAPGLVCKPTTALAVGKFEGGHGGDQASGVDTAHATPSLSAKLADIMDHSLGRAPRGVCVQEESGGVDEREAAVEGRAEVRDMAATSRRTQSLREEEERAVIMGKDDLLRPESTLHSSQAHAADVDEGDARAGRPGGRQGSCPGCPHQVEVSDPEVVAAADAAVELMGAKGDLGQGSEGKGWRVGRIVSATSQVVSGIRYRIVLLAVKAGGGEGTWDVDIVSQPWMTPKYTLIKATRVTKAGGAGDAGEEGGK